MRDCDWFKNQEPKLDYFRKQKQTDRWRKNSIFFILRASRS